MRTALASVPLLEPPASLRVDGVPRALGDAAVLEPTQAEAFPRTLPWTLQLWGPAAQRLAALPGIASGRPGYGAATRLLTALRPLLRGAAGARPRFVLCTVDRVEVGPAHVRLAGTCAPLLPEPPRSPPPAT